MIRFRRKPTNQLKHDSAIFEKSAYLTEHRTRPFFEALRNFRFSTKSTCKTTWKTAQGVDFVRREIIDETGSSHAEAMLRRHAKGVRMERVMCPSFIRLIIIQEKYTRDSRIFFDFDDRT